MLEDIIHKREIPSIAAYLRHVNAKDNKAKRQVLLDMMLKEEYGYLPPLPDDIRYTITYQRPDFCAGKATLTHYALTCIVEGKEFTFPVRAVVPNDKKRHSAFLHINFTSMIPDKYQPTEEIIDNGFAVLSFNYQEVATDDDNFADGLAGVVYENGKRGLNDCGKIGLWSWAASRVIDLAIHLDCFDNQNIYVTGHSRLGKTALLTAALDERVRCGFVNCSGCSGDAISRDKTGETVRYITKVFPYWFCKNYLRYAEHEKEMLFDQHFLLGAVAPRNIYISTAVEDTWADPDSQYLSCVCASEAYQDYKLSGFVHPDALPKTGDCFHQGEIGFNMRSGTHYQSRDDWKHYFSYIQENFR